MSEIHSLVYVSSATRVLSGAELHHLLDSAQRRNLGCEVTGVLLHCDGNFMQYIEGPPQGLEHVYRIICKDTKHGGLIELFREIAQEREFGDWSMALQTTAVGGYAGPSIEGTLLGCAPHGSKGGVSLSRLLLQNFWNRAVKR